jgi:glutaconate CoA-transferase, subunit B
VEGTEAVITDLGILKPDLETRELIPTSQHPETMVEQAVAATGWKLRVSSSLATTAAPTRDELAALRDLMHHPAEAHHHAFEGAAA